MLRILATLFLVLPLALLHGQTDHQEHSVEIKRSHIFNPRDVEPAFNAQLRHIEAPSPDGKGYKSFLMRQKIKSRELYPVKTSAPQKKSQTTTPQPVEGQGMNLTYRFNFGLITDYSGGIPNDNTLAISNDGIILAAVNGGVWGYDLNTDTVTFTQNHIMSFSAIAGNLGSNHLYDPKLHYDETADRFILVFLRDNVPASSAMIVAFSSTNDPTDPWYVYQIPGNPLDNNRWTDFPAISITDDELFMTGNLVIPNEPWQIGFDGSVIWQIDKHAGYRNDSILPNKLYSDIRFAGKYIRNIHPVNGLGSTAARQFFLSNRNFAVTNDTIFIMEIEGLLSDTQTTLKIGMGKSSTNYGVPPNGRQEDTDLNDPTKGLQTNDARVLGAITNGEWIQFVANTINPETGFSAIYHGSITNPGEPEQKITGRIIGDDVLDFGYPNIAYTGNELCDIQSIIGVNFTSPTDHPGVGAFYFSNDSSYSDLLRVKDGANYVDKHQDSYERWGDYFGIQPKFNETGKVWIAGFYGMENNRSGTWVNELTTPDSLMIVVQAATSGNATCCAGRVDLQASGGVGPYSYSFNGSPESTTSYYEGFCEGDSVVYKVLDSRGCFYSDTILFEGDPSSTAITAQADLTGNTILCQGRLDVEPSGGTPPYLFSFNGDSATANSYYEGVCDADTVVYTVTDSCGSTYSDTVSTPLLIASTEDAVYPNPSPGEVMTQFNLSADRQVSAYIYDMRGVEVVKLIDAKAKKGLNEFQFSLAPLGQGMYVLRILADGKDVLLEEKIVVQK